MVGRHGTIGAACRVIDRREVSVSQECEIGGPQFNIVVRIVQVFRGQLTGLAVNPAVSFFPRRVGDQLHETVGPARELARGLKPDSV